MKISIEAANKKEAELIKLAMDDAAVRAFVVVMGALLTLDSDRSRHRVMAFVKDYFDELDDKAAVIWNKSVPLISNDCQTAAQGTLADLKPGNVNSRKAQR